MALDSLSAFSFTSLAVAAVSMALASLVWWRRLARLGELRARVERIYALSEQILDLDTQNAVRELVEESLAAILAVDLVEVVTTLPHSPPPGTRFIPMTYRGESSGWIELRAPGLRLQQEEESAVRHLANQIAIAQELTYQRALQERLLRSERQGAVGQLISSIAAELKPPLQRLADAHDPASAGRDASEALSVLERLLSFARPDREQRALLDIGAMLRDLLDLRSEAMRLALVRVEPEVFEAPLGTVGSRSQLEQAFLNVLVFAEQSLAGAQHRIGRLSARIAGGWVNVILRFDAQPGGDAEALLAVSRGVVEAHGGIWKMDSGPGRTSIEILLPASEPPPSPPRPGPPAKSLTLLIVAPDTTASRQLAELALACGHRVVPATAGGDALLLASRFTFDAVFSTESLPDMPWTEFAPRMRQSNSNLAMLLPHGLPPPDGVPALRMPASSTDLRNLLDRFAGLHPPPPHPERIS
jgi:signal transduction histidine kinase/CheY-like chemotaxis protein